MRLQCVLFKSRPLGGAFDCEEREREKDEEVSYAPAVGRPAQRHSRPCVPGKIVYSYKVREIPISHFAFPELKFSATYIASADIEWVYESALTNAICTYIFSHFLLTVVLVFVHQDECGRIIEDKRVEVRKSKQFSNCVDYVPQNYYHPVPPPTPVWVKPVDYTVDIPEFDPPDLSRFKYESVVIQSTPNVQTVEYVSTIPYKMVPIYSGEYANYPDQVTARNRLFLAAQSDLDRRNITGKVVDVSFYDYGQIDRVGQIGRVQAYEYKYVPTSTDYSVYVRENLSNQLESTR